MMTSDRPRVLPFAPIGLLTAASGLRVAVGALLAVVRAPAANAAARAGTARRVLRDMRRRLGGEAIEQREAHVEHALEGGDRDALIGLVVALGAVGDVGARKALGLERVVVRAAAGDDPRGLVAAVAQRLLGGEHACALRLVAVAGEELLDHQIDVAVAGWVVGGVMDEID